MMYKNISYAGYLRITGKTDKIENFRAFMMKALKRNLLPIEKKEAECLYEKYRFCNEYRCEIEA